MSVTIGDRPQDGYSIIPNAWSRDSRLSLSAKGLLLYLNSHAKGYHVTVAQMIAQNKDGRDAIYAAIGELEAHGYLKRVRRRDPRTGRFGAVDYVLTDRAPLPGNPEVGLTSDNTASSQVSPRPGLPEVAPTSDNAAKPQVAPTSGFTGSGKSDTKKTKTKKTKSKKTKSEEDQRRRPSHINHRRAALQLLTDDDRINGDRHAERILTAIERQFAPARPDAYVRRLLAERGGWLDRTLTLDRQPQTPAYVPSGVPSDVDPDDLDQWVAWLTEAQAAHAEGREPDPTVWATARNGGR